jgi:rhodanese-related sulfurtransferase
MTTVNNSQKLNTIDAQTLQKLVNEDKIILIDVREPSEYSGERIEGAKLVPLSSFSADKIPQNSDKPVVLYCQSDNRSGEAARKLFQAGFQEVTHLEGGLNKWKQQSLPTQVNKNAPISIMRQVQIIAGTLILTGTLLGAFVSPKWLFLTGFVGSGLLFAGVSNTCMMATLLAKLPYNQKM